MDVHGDFVRSLASVAQKAARSPNPLHRGTIAPGYYLQVDRLLDDDGRPYLIEPDDWDVADHLTLPENFMAVTPNAVTTEPHQADTAQYLEAAAMEAVYDPELRRRVADPVPTVPLMEGVHVHGSALPAWDAALGEGGHAQFTGSGAHTHGPGGHHAHDVVTPPALRPLMPGDQVGVLRVYDERWLVVCRIVSARTLLEGRLMPRVGRI
jgi:hypothetical protein